MLKKGKSWLLAAVAVTAVLSGCSNHDYSTKEMMTANAGCCEGPYSQLVYKVIPANADVRLSVNGEDQVMDLPSGRSFVEALALPEYVRPYWLELQSEVVRSKTEGGKVRSLFFPVMTFLDENKQPIKTIDDAQYRYLTPLVGRDRIRMLIPMRDELVSAKYVLIYTTDRHLARGMSTSEPHKQLQTRKFNTMVFAPVPDAKYRIDFGPEGWLRLKTKSSLVDPS